MNILAILKNRNFGNVNVMMIGNNGQISLWNKYAGKQIQVLTLSEVSVIIKLW